MKTTVVRYKTRPEHAQENAALIAAVFEQLARERPTGLHYQAMRGEDGVSFVHVVTVDPALPAHPLTGLAAFKAFTAGIRARCEEAPQPDESTLLGRYPK